jgi:hypothetical protein
MQGILEAMRMTGTRKEIASLSHNDYGDDHDDGDDDEWFLFCVSQMVMTFFLWIANDMFLFGNDMFLFGNDKFLYAHNMFLYTHGMFLFASDLFRFANDNVSVRK